MADQNVVEYIRRNLARGSPIEEIEKKLLAQGWSEPEIEEAVSAVSEHAQASKKASGKMWLAIIAATLIVGVGAIVAASFLVFGGFSFPGDELYGTGGNAECDAKDEGVYRALCYTDIAIGESDVTVCNALRNTDERKFKDICIRDYAVGKVELDTCGLVENTYIKDQCIERVREKASQS